MDRAGAARRPFSFWGALEPYMSIEQSEVEKVALLARLALSPEEVARFSADLSRIVTYVAQIRECDVDGVSAELDPDRVANVLRADVVQPSLPRDLALENAPDTDGAHFRVPAVLPISNS